MTEYNATPAGSGGGAAAKAFLSRFWSFETLIGHTLIKIMYYVGLVAIGLGALVLLAGALTALRYDAGAGLLSILGAVLLVVGGTVVWRFYCELAILLFQIYHRMGEIRDRLPPPL